MSTVREFFVQGNDRVIGPLTPAQLRALAASGQIGADKLVSLEGVNWDVA